jgi:sulfate adenylyltransferase
MPPRGRARIVVLAGRPPLRADISQVQQLGRKSGAEVVWMVPVASPTPDGVPPSVLVRTVKAAAAMVIGSRVIASPMWWRDPLRDRALAEAVAEAYGGTHLVRLDPAAVAPAGPHPTPGESASPQDPWTGSERLVWAKLHKALQAGTDVPDVAPADVLAELRRWRPARDRRGLVILFTGFSGSGKSTLARRLVDRLTESSERSITLLDGDVVRALLSSGLGFDHDSRDLNVRRIGFVAAEVARHGGIAVCAPIAPYQASRDAVRAMAEAVGDFVLIHVSTSLEVCEQRDLKGLYAKARAGLVAEFTGVSDPYDVPRDADLTIDTSSLSQEAGVAQVLTFLRRGGWLNHPEGA